jgi:hypothetical protein
MSDEVHSNRDWIMLVKRTREKFGVSIEGAHDLILADEEMRRLVALRINSNPECRKMAWNDIRRNGAGSRFVKVDGRIRFRPEA